MSPLPLTKFRVGFFIEPRSSIANGRNGRQAQIKRGMRKKGGRIAGNARRELEAETGRPVVSSTNYLEQPQREQKQLPDSVGQDDE